ncbi:hypothetical protein NJF35_24435, partial [Pseudomonas guariconensis]|nr:hypothetical protein [Pseudomonas guariconensis]
AISRLRRLRQTSTSNKQVRPWRPDLNETASTKAGAVHLAGTTSEPFVADSKGQIAIKVIDERGNELMRVLNVAEAE